MLGSVEELRLESVEELRTKLAWEIGFPYNYDYPDRINFEPYEIDAIEYRVKKDEMTIAEAQQHVANYVTRRRREMRSAQSGVPVVDATSVTQTGVTNTPISASSGGNEKVIIVRENSPTPKDEKKPAPTKPNKRQIIFAAIVIVGIGVLVYVLKRGK
jgi:hypothetical protein